MMARRDWDSISRQYIEGIEKDGVRKYPTMRELCEQHGITIGALGKKAKQDQWAVKREMFANKVQTACEQKTIEAISTEGSSFDLKCFNVAVKATEILEHKISKTGPDGFFLIDDLNKLSATLKNLQIVGRLALGEPIDISKNSSDVKISPDVINDPAKREARINELIQARKGRSGAGDTP